MLSLSELVMLMLLPSSGGALTEVHHHQHHHHHHHFKGGIGAYFQQGEKKQFSAIVKSSQTFVLSLVINCVFCDCRRQMMASVTRWLLASLLLRNDHALRHWFWLDRED